MRLTAKHLIAATAAAGLLAAGCGSSKKPASTGSAAKSPTTAAAAAANPLFAKLPASVQSSKQIKIGSDIEYAPIEFYKEGTQETQGVDWDLAQALGDKLGVKVTFVDDTDFAGIIGALNAGRFDAVMAAMNDTSERRGKGVDFIDYFKAGSSILVQKGNPKHVQSLGDLCGQTVSVQKGTVQDTDILAPQEAACQKAGKQMNVLRLEKDTDALQQVKNGRAVADLQDFPVAAYNAQTSGNGADFEVTGNQVGDVGQYGIAVPTANAQLRDALQSALKAAIDDGTYDKVLAKWSVSSGALKTATINGGL